MYNRFVELLQEKQITPYKLSKETGIWQSTLSDWKLGKSTPKLDKLEKIAEYLGVTVDYLLGKTDIKENIPKENDLSEKEQLLLKLFRCSSEENQELIIRMMKSFGNTANNNKL